MMKFNLPSAKRSDIEPGTEPEFDDIHDWALFGRWMMVVVAVDAAVIGYILVIGMG